MNEDVVHSSMGVAELIIGVVAAVTFGIAAARWYSLQPQGWADLTPWVAAWVLGLAGGGAVLLLFRLVRGGRLADENLPILGGSIFVIISSCLLLGMASSALDRLGEAGAYGTADSIRPFVDAFEFIPLVAALIFAAACGVPLADRIPDQA